jgi:hypothetical protein
MSIDLNRVQRDAEAFVLDNLGQDRLARLIGSMLDYEVAPIFLWRDDYPGLAANAGAAAVDLRANAPSTASIIELLPRNWTMLGLDREPERAVLKLATARQYFRDTARPPENGVFSHGADGTWVNGPGQTISDAMTELTK